MLEQFFYLDHRQFLQTQGSTNGTTITPTEQSSRGAVAHPGGARPRHSAATNDDAAFNRKLKHMGKSKHFQIMAVLLKVFSHPCFPIICCEIVEMQAL